MKPSEILVLGATGYVGSRLVHSLIDSGYSVRASYRTEEKARQCTWFGLEGVTSVKADVLEYESLLEVSRDIDVIYYLIHSMYGSGNFVQTDRRAARNTASVAKHNGVQRIVYLGGLGEESGKLSKHLKSRIEVRDILETSEIPVTTLRAAMIVGSGSASFEIMRYLVDRLPVMTTPRWVRTLSQPIAISNVLQYLVGALEESRTIGKVLDIGGPQILRYHDLMTTYAEEAGLIRRLIIPLPILSPQLSSYWVDLVTPIPASIARPLVEGLQNETICTNTDILGMIPLDLLSIRDAIRLALSQRMHLSSKKFIPEWTQPNDPPWSGSKQQLLPIHFPLLRL
ncbi:MAG: NAD(P)H-binding protein [Candidatus Thorarchaeota archaeon]